MSEGAQMDSSVKTNAMLAWIFAPITSFIWRDEQDDFLKSHARESLYFGIANVVFFAVIFVLQLVVGVVTGIIFNSLYSLFWLASLISCFWTIVWLAYWAFTVIPRIMGLIKANNGEKWSVPYVNAWVAKFIKL